MIMFDSFGLTCDFIGQQYLFDMILENRQRSKMVGNQPALSNF